jgi:hypothetical protein
MNMKTEQDIEIKICQIEKDIADLKRNQDNISEYAVELLEFSIDTLKWVLGQSY